MGPLAGVVQAAHVFDGIGWAGHEVERLLAEAKVDGHEHVAACLADALDSLRAARGER